MSCAEVEGEKEHVVNTSFSRCMQRLFYCDSAKNGSRHAVLAGGGKEVDLRADLSHLLGTSDTSSRGREGATSYENGITLGSSPARNRKMRRYRVRLDSAPCSSFWALHVKHLVSYQNTPLLPTSACICKRTEIEHIS